MIQNIPLEKVLFIDIETVPQSGDWNSLTETDQNLWDNVQALLAENRTAEGYEKNRMESPFKGLLKCGYCGGSLGITYTQKHDRRYTYYVCIKDDKKAISECPL